MTKLNKLADTSDASLPLPILAASEACGASNEAEFALHVAVGAAIHGGAETDGSLDVGEVCDTGDVRPTVDSCKRRDENTPQQQGVQK